MLLVFVYLIILFYLLYYYLFYFILLLSPFPPSVFLFRCMSHSLPLPLSSYLGRIPPLIGLPLLRSLLRSVFCAYSLFLLLFAMLFVFSVYCLSRRCPVLATFLLVLLCLISLLISKRIPGMIWLGSVYLVTTAGFVADQLIRDNNSNNNNSNPRPCFRRHVLLPVPGALFSPRYHIARQAPGLASEADN